MQMEVKGKKKKFKYSVAEEKRRSWNDALHSPREWDKIDANP